MFLSVRKIIASAALAVAFGVTAQVQAPTDSVSAAAATAIGNYFLESLERQYPADGVAREQFVSGVEKSFEMEPFEAIYYNGVSNGMNIKGNLEQLRASGFPIDNAVFLEYFKKVMDGQPTGFTTDEADAYMTEIQARNRRAGELAQQEFLDAQAAREGVIKTASGLLFEVIEEGEGESPVASDTVEVIYTGKLADGTVFDTSGTETVSFPVGRLIPGFTEGLMLMKPGGTYRLFIPSSLGYGERGAGNEIPGGAALEFIVKLVDIKK